MDFTYVRIIIGGTRNKIKIKFIQCGGPPYTAKTVRDWNKIDSEGKFSYKTKEVYHLQTSHIYVLSLEVL